MPRPVALALALALPVLALASGANPPHVLFVVADDYGWNDVGYHTDRPRRP